MPRAGEPAPDTPGTAARPTAVAPQQAMAEADAAPVAAESPSRDAGMTHDAAAARAVSDAAQVRRAGRFIGWLLVATVAAAALELVFYLAAPELRTGIATVLLVVLAGWLVLARAVLARGSTSAAVAMASGGLLVAIPVAALVVRNEAGLAVAPLIAVAAALPYLGRRALAVISCVAVLVGVAAALAQHLVLPPAPPASAATVAFRIGVVATALGLVLFLLWQYSSRLKDLLAERERSAEVLRTTADTLRSLIESSPLAITVLDRAGAVRLVNPAFVTMFGWTADEVVGQPPPQILSEEQHRFRESIERVMRGDAFTGLEARRRRKDGSLIDVTVSMGPIRNANGDVEGVMLLGADISERKRLETQLLQAQRMESVGRLAGGIAHDFNNLLTVIIGHADLLLHEASADDPKREEIEAIHQAAKRAGALTAQLLAFSRRQTLRPEVVDLNAVVRQLEPMLRRLIGENITLSTALTDDLGRVQVDQGQMEQVIVNLVINARDAMPNGGKLLIETANAMTAPPSTDPGAELAPGPHVMFAVSDTGTGMDRETQERLFEPFYTTKEEGKGTGLGLATTYGIVKQSGGQITVYSEEGHGSVFTIHLPRVDASAAQPDAEEQPPADAWKGTGTILVVEDDAGVRRLGAWVLERQGYRVLTAESGVDALAVAASEESVDLLLTDVVMPGLAGQELAERMKRFHPGLRVLYMSGYTDEAIVHHGVLEPGVEFINKPFSPNALGRKVRDVLAAGRESAASPTI